jgi:hypothetical protein
MSQQSKKAEVFSGDTFSNLMRQYSNRRMEIDPKYRREVRAEIARRKAARRAKLEAQKATAPVPA